MRIMLKTSVVICLLCFAYVNVKADVEVNINAQTTVSGIQGVIQNAIDAASSGEIITVVNRSGGSDVAYNSANANLTLTIPANVTVLWRLEYSGSATVNPLITLNGAGVFTVGSGGSVTHANNGVALNITGVNATVTVENGGLVVSGGAGSTVASDAIFVEAGGVTVNVNSNGTVKRLTGTSTSPVIHIGNNLSNVVINVNGGSVISEGNGLAIEDGTTANTTNNTSINIGDNAVVQSQNSRAIYSTSTGSVVTVSGGTVSNTSNSNLISVIYMEGGTGENVRITGGTVQTMGAGGYAIQTTGNVSVSGGLVTAINGRAINLVGQDSKAIISGGTVETTGRGAAISTATTNPLTVPNASITVTGGTVKAARGNALHITGINSVITVSGGLVYNEAVTAVTDSSAIYAETSGKIIIKDNAVVEARGNGNAIGTGGAGSGAGSSVEVSGGMVTAKDGSAIRTTATGGGSTITVNGGFVFAYGIVITGTGANSVIRMASGAPAINTPTGNGEVVAWNNPFSMPRPEYFAFSDNALLNDPTASTAVWYDYGNGGGIAYANGSNTGFFPLDVDVIFLNPDTDGILYVDDDMSGDGSSWADAYPNLADPLLYAARQRAILGNPDNLIKQIWVADGTYYPMHTADGYDFAGKVFDDTDGGRDNAFVLVAGVKIYGGFAGTETGIDQRIPNAGSIGGACTLSGDIGTAGSNTDNAYHVIIGIDIPASTNTVMDGFTISGGNADAGSTISVNGKTIERDFGGGMYNYDSSPSIAHVALNGNNASGNGGGMYNISSAPMLINVMISGNNASGGGGMYNNNASPILTNITMSGNSASGEGGGIYNASSSPVINNGILWGNTATSVHNVFNFSSSPTYSYSLVEDVTAPGIISNNDPLFVDETSGNYRLRPGSPAIEAGYNNSFLTARGIVDFTYATDLAGNPRLSGATIDIGAFETSVYLVTVSSDGTGSTGGGYYGEGETVSIYAGTDPVGYRFLNWTTTDGVVFSDVNNASTSFIMPSGTVTVTATYETLYMVTVVSDGTGATGGGYYGVGETVNIEAGADPAGYRFVGWTTTDGITFNDASLPVTFFTMPANAATVTAVFEKLYTVTVISAGTGSSGSGSYLAGAMVNIYAGADPDTDHDFSGWITTSLGVTIAAPGNRMTSFVMPANDVMVIAEFDNLYVVIVSSDGTGATGDGHFHEDETVTVNAGTPPAGMEFAGWTAGSPAVIFADANSATTTFTMPLGNVTVTARFCPAGDKQAIEEAVRLFVEHKWTVVEQTSYTAERLNTKLIDQINDLIAKTEITAACSDITISKIIPPAGQAEGSFDFTITLTECTYIRTFSLSCVIAAVQYPHIIRPITIDPLMNGWIVSDKLFAATRETVTLTIMPNAGYQLDAITAYHTDHPSISVSLMGEGAVRTFVMPPHPVSITAIYTFATDIHDPQAVGLKAYVQDGVLYVSGVAQGSTVRVYNILGALVAAPSNSPEEGEFVLPLPQRGIYIITDGNRTIKINN